MTNKITLHEQVTLAMSSQNLSAYYQEYRNTIIVQVLNLSLLKMLTENPQLVCESRQQGNKH